MLNEIHLKVMLIQTPIDQSYNKVIATIESCKTRKQLDSAIKMANNFKSLYKEVGYPKTLSYNLDRTIYKKYFTCQ